jgi:Uma2 family endonuclease
MMNAANRSPLILTDAQFEEMTRRGAFVNVGRVELRRGMISVMSPVHLSHSTVARNLLFAFSKALTISALAYEVHPEVSVRFGSGFQPTADLVVWDPSAATLIDGPIPAPAVRLVVEVADASLGDDIGDKLLDYANAGLAEYWVADVKGRILLLHQTPTPHGYRTRVPVRFGEAAAALTIPLTVDTSSL